VRLRVPTAVAVQATDRQTDSKLCVLYLQFIIVYGLVGYEPLTYEQYVYPVWANVLGWIIAGSSIIMIPGTAVFKLVTTPGTFMQVSYRAPLDKLTVAHLLIIAGLTGARLWTSWSHFTSTPRREAL
jgi:hypothetical protein